MNKSLAALMGAGIGAGLMFIFDPVRGKSRRALVRDKAVHAAHRTVDAAGATSRDVANRAQGAVAGMRSRLWRRRRYAPDAVLVERVRSAVGRLVSHPGSIDVSASDGVITLHGPVLAAEVGRLIRGVERVRGVHGVVHRLEVHERPENVPGLQGEGRPRGGARFEFWQSNWSPAARLAAGAAGGSLALYGLARRGALGTASGVAGAALVARAATNLELRRMLGLGAKRRAIDIHRTIHIGAPVERVYEVWSDYENFPRFMSNVHKVQQLDERRSRWLVAGPAGTSVEWEAQATAQVPNEVLAWRTVPGSLIQHSGIVHFHPGPSENTTTVDISLSYNPAVGGLGHLVAKLFGADPEHQMEQDLMRMKTFIETGQAPRGAAQPAAQGSESQF